MQRARAAFVASQYEPVFGAWFAYVRSDGGKDKKEFDDFISALKTFTDKYLPDEYVNSKEYNTADIMMGPMIVSHSLADLLCQYQFFKYLFHRNRRRCSFGSRRTSLIGPTNRPDPTSRRPWKLPNSRSLCNTTTSSLIGRLCLRPVKTVRVLQGRAAPQLHDY